MKKLGSVWAINGQKITRSDILAAKRLRQRRQLQWKLRRTEPVREPCFVWVFWTDGLGDTGFFAGWWLYVQTAKRYWQLDSADAGTKKSF